MKSTFVPVNESSLIGNEKKYLAECIDTGDGADFIFPVVCFARRAVS
jgi:hypothetical protein